MHIMILKCMYMLFHSAPQKMSTCIASNHRLSKIKRLRLPFNVPRDALEITLRPVKGFERNVKDVTSDATRVTLKIFWYVV